MASDDPISELPDDLMRPGDVAKLLGVSAAAIYRWCRFGKLACYRIGGIRRISRRDALAMVERVEPVGRPKPKSAHERAQESRKVIETLKKHGLDKYL